MVVAKKVVVNIGTRLQRDLFCEELKINDGESERDLTRDELKRLANGFKITIGRIPRADG